MNRENGNFITEVQESKQSLVARRLSALSFKLVDVKTYAKMTGAAIEDAPDLLIRSGITGKEIAEMRALIREHSIREDRGYAAEIVVGEHLVFPRQIDLGL